MDIGFGEMIALLVIGLIVVGPERLPQYAAQTARFLRQLRAQIDDAKAAVMDAAAVDPETLKDLRDLDPRRALRSAGAEVDDLKTVINQSKLDPDTT